MSTDAPAGGLSDATTPADMMRRAGMTAILLLCVAGVALAQQQPATSATSPDSAYAELRDGGMSALRGGDYAGALRRFERALTYADQLAATDQRRLESRVNLALTLKKLLRFDEAAKRYQEAVDLCPKVNAPPVIHGVLLDNFGNLYDEQRLYEKGEPLHRAALAMFEANLPEGATQILTCRVNLAQTLAEQGRFDEATPLYEKTLAVLETDKERPDRLAIALDNFGGMLARQGKFDESAKQRLRALEIFERMLGPDHPEVAICLMNLGGTELSRGRPKEAEPYIRRALAIDEKVYGAEHALIAPILVALGESLDGQGKVKEAKELRARALAIRRGAAKAATTQPK